MNFTIPKKITVGGQEINVMFKPQEDMDQLGRVNVSKGYLNINKDQTETSKKNTFIHEAVHAILDTAGYNDLSGDETFVSTFAGFVMEIINSIE